MKSLASLLAIMAFLPFWSCKSGDDLYQYASADDLIVMQGDMQTIIDNAGCSLGKDGISLSAALQKLVPQIASRPRDRESLNNILAVKGIDLSQIVISISPNLEPSITFKVTNQKNFKSYLEANSYGSLTETEDKGYTIYSFDTNYAIFLTDNIACYLFSQNKTISVNDIITLKEKAQNSPLSKWQIAGLESGKTFNLMLGFKSLANLMNKYNPSTPVNFQAFSMAYDPDVLENGYFFLNSTLQGLSFSGEAYVLDQQGDIATPKFKGAEVNMDLLKYANEKDIAVIMGAVPGNIKWSEVLNQAVNEIGGPRAIGLDSTSLQVLGELLDNLDGTVMLAMGPVNAQKVDEINGWTGVLVAEMKPGQAQKYVELAKNFIDVTNESMNSLANSYRQMGIVGAKTKTFDTTYENGQLIVNAPDGGAIYIKADGNNFIASLGPISTDGGCKIETSVLQGTYGGLVIDMPRYNAFSSLMSFPFGVNINYLSVDNKIVFSLAETETEGLLLDNIFKFIASQL